MEKNYLSDLLKCCTLNISLNANMDPISCTCCVLGACATIGYVYKTKKECEQISTSS